MSDGEYVRWGSAQGHKISTIVQVGYDFDPSWCRLALTFSGADSATVEPNPGVFVLS